MEGAPGRMPVNVTEAFSLYDTVQIGKEVSLPAGYGSYAALAGLEEIPFFTVRNRTQTGLAYTNKDSIDSLPFVFHVKDIGVRLIAAAPFQALPNSPTATEIADHNAARIFDSLLHYHVGLILKIREDERLAHTVELAPPGTGTFGYTAGAVAANIQSANQGWPGLGNRWTWREPLSIPRNCVLSVVLKPSAYAKELLARMPGPFADLPLVDLATGTAATARRISLIRVSLNGAREVQQRGELHY